MLSNLIKFEWKSMFRYLWIVWAALLAASVLVGITYNVYDGLMGNADSNGILYLLTKVVPTIIYWLMFTAEIIITLIMVVTRFYRGLLCEEGYLMHTLPVKTWQLIASKGIIASVAMIISGIVAGISITIMAVTCFGADISWMKELLTAIGDMKGYAIPAIIEVAIMCFLAVIIKIYEAYLAMSIGQLANKHRILASAGAYIGVNIAISIITSICMSILVFIVDNGNFEYNINYQPETYFEDVIVVAVMILIQIIQLAVYHIITSKILEKKLNLL